MAHPGVKAPAALRTIGEVSRDCGVAQHILRFWETRFPQLKPLQRAGQRRYYRADDVALVRRIDALLNRDGYTIRGVQQLLAAEVPARPAHPVTRPVAPPVAPPVTGDAAPGAATVAGIAIDPVRRVRDALAAALAADGG